MDDSKLPNQPHPTLQEWIELKSEVSHGNLILQEIRDELKDNYSRRLTLLEEWMNQSKGAEALRSFWIPMMVSAGVAAVGFIVTKLFK